MPPSPPEPYWVRKPAVTVGICLGVLIVLFSLCLWVVVNKNNKHVRLYRIAAASMEPTLHMGEDLLVQTDAYKTHPPQRGDVVVFLTPDGRALIVKRVIAVGGDVISGTPTSTSVNGQKLYEPYIYGAGSDRKNDSISSFPEETFGPIHVPPNCFFVIGDYREKSYDSREPSLGCVPLGHIRGKAISTGSRIQLILSRGRAIR